MALKQQRTERMFYSVKEAAILVGEDKSTIKYWEKEFPRHIKPRFSQGGTRAYRKEDIEILRSIKRLRTEGLSIEGIRSKLSNSSTSLELKENTLMRLEACLDRLRDIELHLRPKTNNNP